MAEVVVGTGPAGIAVATALAARGRRVILLDGGKELESSARARQAKLAKTPAADWNGEERAAYMAPQFETPVGQVRRHGSDFAMEPADATYADIGDVALRASRAVGGLSNIWGSAVLPYAAKDISDWPFPAADLAPHYRALADLMPISGTSDGLAALFADGLPAGARQIPPTAQAEELLARLGRRADRVAKAGVHVGAARQAVSPDCTRCGLCLHGCPYGHIWSSARALEKLKANPRVGYFPGTVVHHFAEHEEGVDLYCADGVHMQGERVYLAAGVLETARILLASDPFSGKTLTLQDSQHAFLPMLHRWSPPRRPDALPLTTLPQVFVEIDAPDVSPHLVHAQLYSWNDFYARELRQNYGRKLPGGGGLLDRLAQRLIVAQLFLHSDHSARIDLTLAEDGRLKASPRPASDGAAVLSAASRRMSKVMGQVGVRALTFARRDGAPGSSFHVGGSLPMAARPGPGQSDTLGRPHGSTRLHVVDASVLPTVPATTITFGVMANAHRIGTLAP